MGYPANTTPELNDDQQLTLKKILLALTGGGSGGPIGLTDTQLRATPVPVSLPAGAPQTQYSGVPSSFAFRTANETVFTLAAGEVGFIQNCDDVALAVKKGAAASPTSLSMILKGCSVADDGSGGYTIIKDWVGVVSVAAMAGTARYLAWKQAP